MAESKMFNVSEDFNVLDLADKISLLYRQRGYISTWNNLGSGVCIEISKNTDGINNVVGLCEGIKVNIIKNGNLLQVNYTDEKWVDKIIAFLIGWVLCWIPWIPGAIGAYRQFQLSKNISNDIQMMVGSIG